VFEWGVGEEEEVSKWDKEGGSRRFVDRESGVGVSYEGVQILRVLYFSD